MAGKPGRPRKNPVPPQTVATPSADLDAARLRYETAAADLYKKCAPYQIREYKAAKSEYLTFLGSARDPQPPTLPTFKYGRSLKYAPLVFALQHSNFILKDAAELLFTDEFTVHEKRVKLELAAAKPIPPGLPPEEQKRREKEKAYFTRLDELTSVATQNIVKEIPTRLFRFLDNKDDRIALDALKLVASHFGGIKMTTKSELSGPDGAPLEINNNDEKAEKTLNAMLAALGPLPKTDGE